MVVDCASYGTEVESVVGFVILSPRQFVFLPNDFVSGRAAPA